MYMCFGVWEKASEVCLLFHGLPHLVLLFPSSFPLMMKCSALNYCLLQVCFLLLLCVPPTQYYHIDAALLAGHHFHHRRR